jgi:acetyl-CoA synthetase
MTFRINTLDEYQEAYQGSINNPTYFWEQQALHFQWEKKWETVFHADFHGGHNQWFIGGKLNITVNCLDRHLSTIGEQTAILWEPNDPDQPIRKLSYIELHASVCQFANGLRAQGIKKGDRVCFYMPMVPELVIGILACARIGAIHSVVFAGFSAVSLADRINDASCNTVICADYNARGAKNIPVKSLVDEALALGCESVEKVIVFRNTGEGVSWVNGRDLWWHQVTEGQESVCEPEIMDSEDLLFILYTSGSTGKPKGAVHTCGGYMVYTSYSFTNVFQYNKGEVYWCTADVGWITGHSYIIYGPLLSGATTLLFEGTPMYPDASRFWRVCEKHAVNIFYTAPTAIRSLMAAGDSFAEGHDLSSIRVLGSVGEPINEEAWHWYQEKIGRGVVPVVDTWWQTETGGILITPLPYITDTKPCHASYPMPGVQPLLVDPAGVEIEGNDVEGLLCIRFPWPSIIRTTYGDHERCRLSYFSAFPGLYFTGDGARRDHEGRYRIIGRVDDVINVSGHRIGTAEIENAIDEHDNIVESAVVGYPHPIKGQGIYAFVIVLHPVENEIVFRSEINDKLVQLIGPIAKTDEIMIVTGLPKTRSGKIMRRVLRKIAEKELEHLGDISTLLNPEIVNEIIDKSLQKNNS